LATLTELRDYVRTQTDTNTDEIPNATIDNYLHEAFDRTINAEAQWPFFEQTWTGTQIAGNNYFAMPSDCEELTSVVDTDNNAYRMTQIDLNEAEDQYFRVTVSSGYASEYAIWQDIAYLFPRVTFDADRSYALRGYRQPTDWLAGSPAVTEPDCDERLHRPLCHYAVALAYAQQEDEVLEATYMARWQRDVEIARKIIMGPSHQRPLVMGPHRTTRIGHGRYRPSFSIDP
jgi:hypothetical protein